MGTPPGACAVNPLTTSLRSAWASFFSAVSTALLSFPDEAESSSRARAQSPVREEAMRCYGDAAGSGMQVLPSMTPASSAVTKAHTSERRARRLSSPQSASARHSRSVSHTSTTFPVQREAPARGIASSAPG